MRHGKTGKTDFLVCNTQQPRFAAVVKDMACGYTVQPVITEVMHILCPQRRVDRRLCLSFPPGQRAIVLQSECTQIMSARNRPRSPRWKTAATESFDPALSLSLSRMVLLKPHD